MNKSMLTNYGDKKEIRLHSGDPDLEMAWEWPTFVLIILF